MKLKKPYLNPARVLEVELRSEAATLFYSTCESFKEECIKKNKTYYGDDAQGHLLVRAVEAIEKAHEATNNAAVLFLALQQAEHEFSPFIQNKDQYNYHKNLLVGNFTAHVQFLKTLWFSYQADAYRIKP